jgi:hypothetical protein
MLCYALKSLASPIALLIAGIALVAPAHADDFTFSFTNTNPGYTSGTVTGIVYGLADNGSPGPATDVVITSYPAATCNGSSCGLTNDTSASGWSISTNDFTETSGSIQSGFFQAQWQSPPFSTNPADASLDFNTSSDQGSFEINLVGGISPEVVIIQGPITFSPYTPSVTPPVSPPVSATPEPGTVGLVLSGMILLAWMLRRQAAAAL